MDVEDLWIQQKIRGRTVDLVKVLGAGNPVNILTKYDAAYLLNKMLQKIGMVCMAGRASAAPGLREKEQQATALMAKHVFCKKLKTNCCF